MWFFTKKKEPVESAVTYARETTFISTTLINGQVYTAEAGIHERQPGLFSPWYKTEFNHGFSHSYIYPRHVLMNRERATYAARLLGQAQEIVALLSKDQLLDKADD